MKFREANTNLYFQLYLYLKNQIILGELVPGTKIPTIDEMHRLYGISHGTVRKALDILKAEGLVFKKRGAGTFVENNVDLFLWHPRSSLEELKRSFEKQKIQPISEEWQDAPQRIKKIFADQEGVFRDGQILCIKRLLTFVADPRIRNLVDSYIPAWVGEEVDIERLRTGSIASIIMELKGFKSIRITQTLRPWTCDIESRNWLGLEEGTPIFSRSWVFFNEEQRPWFYQESLTTANALIREIDLN